MQFEFTSNVTRFLVNRGGVWWTTLRLGLSFCHRQLAGKGNTRACTSTGKLSLSFLLPSTGRKLRANKKLFVLPLYRIFLLLHLGDLCPTTLRNYFPHTFAVVRSFYIRVAKMKGRCWQTNVTQTRPQPQPTAPRAEPSSLVAPNDPSTRNKSAFHRSGEVKAVARVFRHAEVSAAFLLNGPTTGNVPGRQEENTRRLALS